MIRVLHFGLNSKLGGIETYLHKLYTNIDRNEFQFDFLCIGDEEPCWYDEFTKMGSKFYYATPRSKNPIKNKREIYELLKNEKFDIVHCHLNTLSYITPIKAALANNIPTIVHSRNGGAVKSKVTNTLHKLNLKTLPKEKITKLAVSDLAGEWLFGKNTDYMVINNGLNIEKYAFKEENREKIRKEFDIDDELVIIHLGAMRTQKNHMFILDTFKELLNYKSSAKLLLVGDGELKCEIIKKIEELKIKDNVILAGKRNDVCEMLCAGDIFLFPSFFEGFPNAVLEAQTTGLPCLISDDITDEVVITDSCFKMSLSYDAKTWANKLLNINLNKNREFSNEIIKKHGLSVEDEIKKIVNIYNKILINN